MCHLRNDHILEDELRSLLPREELSMLASHFRHLEQLSSVICRNDQLILCLPAGGTAPSSVLFAGSIPGCAQGTTR